MYVQARFELTEETKSILKSSKPEFGYNGFGELVFFRTYSRIKDASKQENWSDVVIRVINGVFSIRKDWYIKNHIQWHEQEMQTFARNMAISMFKMHWMPPGRGLWAMGTNFVYERGSMSLYNCAACHLDDDFENDLHWLMDSLMCGVGTGFHAVRDNNLKLIEPVGTYEFVVEDCRESWCDSEKALIVAFKTGGPLPIFKYHKIRPPGALIKGFGGVCSGYKALEDLHIKTKRYCEWYIRGYIDTGHDYDSVMLKTDLANLIGCCVVAGNIRRSAELAAGSMKDPVFKDLKNYKKYPYRAEHGWMSNNSVYLHDPEDFEDLGEIAKRVISNGEPGYINLKNTRYGRIGKFDDWEKYGLRLDQADLYNPCGEISIEDHETCNVCDTCPTRCTTDEEWLDGCEYAAFYCSTVSLLPTHRPETNAVVSRNRRIGVSLIDFSGWKQSKGVYKVIPLMRKGYDIIRKTNTRLNDEAGVPRSIKVTTVKPGGTIPKLVGKTPGIGHPNFEYMIRRIRIGHFTPIFKILHDAGIPHEPDLKSANTEVFEFPVYNEGKSAGKVSLWEQAMNLVLVQREWADNAVSNTLNFKPKWALVDEATKAFGDDVDLFVDDYEPKEGQRLEITRDSNGKPIHAKILKYDKAHEEDDIEAVLSSIAPYTKSVSLLPHSSKGAYKQMPEEGITKEEYEKRLAAIQPIDWSTFSGSDGVDEKFCNSDHCELPVDQPVQTFAQTTTS